MLCITLYGNTGNIVAKWVSEINFIPGHYVIQTRIQKYHAFLLVSPTCIFTIRLHG